MIRRLLPLTLFLLPVLACSTNSYSHDVPIATEVARQLTAATANHPGGILPREQRLATEVARQLTAAAHGNPSSITSAGPIPTISPTTSPTLIPSLNFTPTASPSNTPPADDPSLSLGNPTWHDAFDNGNNWILDDDGSIRMEVNNHALSVFGTADKFYDAWRCAPGTLAPNYYLQMSAEMEECSGADRFGLVFGGTDFTHLYLFGMSCDGKYSFRFYDGDTHKYTTYIDWTPSSFITTGPHTGNRLGVKVEGTHLAFYINGHYAKDKNVSSFGNGHYGIFASSVNTANFHLVVSDFAFWKIP